MTLTDVLLIVSLAVFALAWWVRRMPARRIVLIVTATGAAILGMTGVLDDRWQDIVGALVGLMFLVVLGGVVLKNRLTRTDRTGGVPWLSGVFVALGCACAVGIIQLFPVWPLPKPTGQYAVGVRSFEVVDASRKGVFLAGPDEPRRLLVRVWYPAGDVSGRPRAPYMTKAETDSTARVLGATNGAPFFFVYLRHAQTNAYVDAPLLPSAANLPTVIYSHGYTSFLSQNTSLMEELASHGYVAFSLQHTYDSADTAFPNGDVARIDPELLKPAPKAPGQPSFKEVVGGDTFDKRLGAILDLREFDVKTSERIAAQSTRTWIADRIFLHDTLQKSPPDAVADIVRASNLEKVGELGMSFGGAIAGELCLIDPRCAAGVNMDGANFPFSAVDADEPVPFLMFHSDRALLHEALNLPVPATGARSFNEFSYERLATAGSRADIYRISLSQSRHIGFSDLSWFVRQPVAGPVFGTTPAEIMLGAQNAFIRGFLDKHLRGEVNDFPSRQLTEYKGWVTTMPNNDIPAWWNAKPEAERKAIEARIAALKPVYGPAPPT